MSHVGEAPAICNLAHHSMCLVRIFESISASRKSSSLDQSHDRGILRSQECVGVSNAHSSCTSNTSWIETGICQSCFYAGPDSGQYERLAIGNTHLGGRLHGFGE